MTNNSDKRSSDEDILVQMRTNPQKGFAMLFHAYYEEVCRHIYQYIPNQTIVEDIAQELFTELWTKREGLNIKISAGAYLRKMAVTRALNYIRDNKKHVHEGDESLAFKRSNLDSPDEKIKVSELSDCVTHAIDSLPDRCRLVFVLSRFEDMSNAEIAKELDISIKTVENQMTKALKVLRIAVDNYRSNA